MLDGAGLVILKCNTFSKVLVSFSLLYTRTKFSCCSVRLAHLLTDCSRLLICTLLTLAVRYEYGNPDLTVVSTSVSHHPYE